MGWGWVGARLGRLVLVVMLLCVMQETVVLSMED
jgi:hypothetical protein